MELVASKIATWELSAKCIMNSLRCNPQKTEGSSQDAVDALVHSPPTCCTPATAALRLHIEELAVMPDEVCALCILRLYGNEYTPLPTTRLP